MECGSREKICKYPCRVRHASQFVSTAVRSHYTQAALPEQFTELSVSKPSKRERVGGRKGGKGLKGGGCFIIFTLANGIIIVLDICLVILP